MSLPTLDENLGRPHNVKITYAEDHFNICVECVSNHILTLSNLTVSNTLWLHLHLDN